MRSFAIFSLLVANCATAFEISNPDAALQPRFPYAGGGWGLTTDSCPTGTYTVDGGGGYQHCCPNGMVAPGVGLACCVGEDTCNDALLATPFCADSNWVLWNATGTFFCCLTGQIGTTSAVCVSGTTDVAATLSASKIGQPSPSGAADATFSASATESTSPTITPGPSSTATTTKGSINSLISSAVSVVTGHSKSDAVVLTPLSWKFGGSSVLNLGTVLAGLVGFGIVLFRI